MGVELKTLTYTSLASVDLTDEALNAIHRTARDLNALDGITGLLIFNGTKFLQIVEGPAPAVDELLERLRRDRRHSGVQVRHCESISDRRFDGWTMELVKVRSRFFEAREEVSTRLPPNLPNEVRDHIFKLTELISNDLTMDH